MTHGRRGLRSYGQVEGVSVGVRVVRVESDDANTIAKITADLLGVSSSS